MTAESPHPGRNPLTASALAALRGSRATWCRRAVWLTLGFGIWALRRQGWLDYLTWDWFKERQAEWQLLVADNPLRSVALFLAVYVAAAGLALPGTVVLSIGAGVLFGRWPGTVLVSVASTAGAVVAFLYARHLLIYLLPRPFRGRLEVVSRRFDTDGLYYLLGLRLLPVAPYPLVNLGMGFSRMPLRTFWWVSQLGMLPLTFLYVNAGAELGRIDRPEALLAPGPLISLGVLAVLVVAGRLLLRSWKPGWVQPV